MADQNRSLRPRRRYIDWVVWISVLGALGPAPWWRIIVKLMFLRNLAAGGVPQPGGSPINDGPTPRKYGKIPPS